MLYLLTGVVILLLFILALAWFGSNYLIARRKPDPAASPSDYGLSFEDVEFQSSDGLTLRGWYIPAPASARTVIVCSGHNGSMDPDVVVAPWLHAAGFNVLMFDWRGHGRSQGRQVSIGYNERYDLLGAVGYAQARGARRIGVLGFSMGGSVALSTAAGCPAIDAVAADGAFARLLTAVTAGLTERGVWRGLAQSLAGLFIATANLRLGVNLFEIDPARWIDRIAPRPILLMYGARDPFAPGPEVDRLYGRAQSPKELWRVPEAAHRDLQVHRPDEYRQKIVDFFLHSL